MTYTYVTTLAHAFLYEDGAEYFILDESYELTSSKLSNISDHDFRVAKAILGQNMRYFPDIESLTRFLIEEKCVILGMTFTDRRGDCDDQT